MRRRLWRVLLDRLGRAGFLDWSSACLDLASVPAKRRREKTGPSPVDRGRPGAKRHLVVDGGGVPLAVVLTGAQVHDSTVFEELIDGIKPVREPKGQPRQRH